MARYTQDPPRRPNDPPNKGLGELQQISHTPESKWPKLSAPDEYVVRRMIRDRKKATLGRKKKSSGFVTLEALLIAISVVALASFLSGCTSYGHERVLPDGTKESTRANFFFQKVNTEALATKVTDNRGTNKYSRTVGLDSFKSEGDKEMAESVSAGATRGALEFMKKSGGIP